MGILLLVVVLAILVTAFAWGLQATAPAAAISGGPSMSSKPVGAPPPTEKTAGKQASDTGNAEAGSGHEKAAAVELPEFAPELDITKARNERRVKVFTHAHTLMVGGLSAEQIARLVDGGRNAELSADIRAAAKIIGTYELAAVLGGRTKDTQDWINTLIKGNSRHQDAAEAGKDEV